MKHHACIGAIALASLFAAPVFAADGLLITSKTTSGTGSSEQQVQLEAHRLRAEITSANGNHQFMVFDGAAQVMRIINDTNKTYMEITKADLERLSAQMSSAMAMMQEQLKNIPPEQRAQVEAMMRGRGMGAAMAQAPKTEYRKTGSDRVGSWACTKYEGLQDGKQVSELCTVSPDALGFTAADFQAMREVADFVKDALPPGMNQDQVIMLGDESTTGFSGVPVRRSMTGSGVTTEITSVKRQNFADAIFNVPEGYKKQSLPMGPQGR
jgi:hypothetical protein